MTPPEHTFAPSRRWVAGIEQPNQHGVPFREEIARFKDRADALLFVKAYNAEHGAAYYRADLWELRYA